MLMKTIKLLTVLAMMMIMPETAFAQTAGKTLFIGNEVTIATVTTTWRGSRGWGSSVGGRDFASDVIFGRIGYERNLIDLKIGVEGKPEGLTRTADNTYRIRNGKSWETSFQDLTSSYAVAKNIYEGGSSTNPIGRIDNNEFDAVVIQLDEGIRRWTGGNIATTAGQATLTTAVKYLLQYIHEKCPNAKVVWVVGAKGNQYLVNDKSNQSLYNKDQGIYQGINQGVYDANQAANTIYANVVNVIDIWQNRKIQLQSGDYVLASTGNPLITQDSYRAVTDPNVLNAHSDLGHMQIADRVLAALKDLGATVKYPDDQNTTLSKYLTKSITFNGNSYVTLSAQGLSSSAESTTQTVTWPANGVFNMSVKFGSATDENALLYAGLSITGTNGERLREDRNGDLKIEPDEWAVSWQLPSSTSNRDMVSVFRVNANTVVKPITNRIYFFEKGSRDNEDGAVYNASFKRIKGSDFELSNNNIAGCFEQAHEVSFRREVKAGQWNTICLPFDMSAEELQSVYGTSKVYQFNGVEKHQNTIHLLFQEEHNSITAGVAYMIKPTKSVASYIMTDLEGSRKVISAPVAPKSYTLDGTTYTFNGLFDPQTISTDDCIVVKDNSTFTNPSSKPQKAFRCYISMSNAVASAKQFEYEAGNGGTTGIEAPQTTTKAVGGCVYTITGQYVGTSTEGLKPGLYVLDGKKIIVK